MGAKISSKDREYFTSNLAYMLKAGVIPSQALQALKDTTTSKPLRNAIDQVLGDIDEGSYLWKAFEKAKIVPKGTLMLIRIGEQSGKLAENLRLAARQEEKQRIFRSKVTSALLYPTFVISLTLIVALGVAWFLLPRLAVTFNQMGFALPLISRIVIGFGLFLQHYGIIFMAGLLLAVVGFIYAVTKVPKMQRLGQTILLKLPGISRLIREIEIARFGYMLGNLLQANINVTESLTLLHGATGALAYKDFYAYLGKSFESGYTFQEAFGKYKATAKVIPAAVQQMVIAGERSGALPESLMDVGQVFEEKADTTIRNLETVLEPILLILVWAGVLVVAVAVILPIYSLVGKLNN
ncbi:MAG TPA: type II secretion system F family protein [Candidatus Saccharimonadales bacterium]|nr:type II secretion system F family protein [Candidatus Saccharimonadales bacterium]